MPIAQYNAMTFPKIRLRSTKTIWMSEFDCAFFYDDEDERRRFIQSVLIMGRLDNLLNKFWFL